MLLGQDGPVAYVWAFLNAKEVEEDILKDMDAHYFADGVREIGARLERNQQRLNQFLAEVLSIQVDHSAPVLGRQRKAAWQHMVLTIQDACGEVMRKYVTGLVPEHFPSDDPFLDLMADAMPEEFARGDHFVMDENGLRSVPVSK